MELYLTNSEQLCITMSRIRAVAEPIQRGDIPYSFSLEQMLQATKDSAQVVAELLPVINADADPAMLKFFSVFSSAQNYLKSMCLYLLTLPEVEQEMKRQLLFVLKVHDHVMKPVMDKMQRNLCNLVV